MRDKAWLDSVRDRVLAEMAANPPTGPLLTELYPEVSPPKTKTCKAGHVRTPGRKCPTCSIDTSGAVDRVRERSWGEGEGRHGY